MDNQTDMTNPAENRGKVRWGRDPLGSFAWGAIFIWAGLVFIAERMNWLPILPVSRIFPGIEIVGGFGAWTYVLVGAGLILLAEVLLRLVLPAFHRPTGGSIFFAFMLIALGLGNVIGWSLIWPLALIAIGIVYLVRGLLRR
ncbi:MAG TPA: hypothetical protein VIO61_16220 [Anaerolineaceae bacterium]